MIRLIIQNRFFSIGMSVLLLLAFLQIRGVINSEMLLKSVFVLALGISTDVLCKRYHVIGKESHLPIFLVCSLSIFFFSLSVRQLMIEGLVSLFALALPLSSAHEELKSEKYLIYFGILIGVAQLFDSESIFLFIPLFVFFMLTGARRTRAFAMSLLYFLLVLVIYTGALFVIDNLEALHQLIPVVSFDLSTFNNFFYRGVLPFVSILVVMHLLFLNTYSFRYPNEMKSITWAFIAQAILCGLIILLTADTKFSLYMILPLTIILSIAFSYKRDEPIVSVSVTLIVLLSLIAVYLNNSSAII